ncbi:MAG: M48 family metalloprotease [Chloroflexi bacterium]|nr:M48 family metalloprotease [Chloroflexota bacterium]
MALDPERQRLARRYARRQRLISLVETAVAGVLLAALAATGASAALAGMLPGFLPLKVALYSIVIMAAFGLVTAPLGLYSGYILPRRFGLSTQTWRGWLLDSLKSDLVGLALGTALLVALYLLLDSFPDTWWIAAALGLLVLSVVLTHLAPVLLIPLFFKQKPLDDAALVERLTGLATSAGTRIRGVFTIDLGSKGTTANAALAGLGSTQRILLSDTLLKSYSPEEIEAVMAHELGHHVGKHLWKTLGFHFVLVIGEFYAANLALRWAAGHWGYTGMADVAAFPLLALALGGAMFLTRPLTLAFSRRHEASADLFALALTRAPGPFVSMMAKLTDQNLGEEHPPLWVELLYYDHPPYYRRVALAQQRGN